MRLFPKSLPGPRRFAACLGLFLAAVLIASCAPLRRPPVVPLPPAHRGDVIHTVAPGETLWRIGKMYSVPVAAILRTNHLSDKTTIRYGQKLAIPNAAPIKPVITLYPSHKWKYIIIHHSGTEEGSSLQFHKSHLKKGWDRGVGYDFVIDNGHSGKEDGQIETTPRWLKQEDGAHCKASDMNVKAIGICLVGNFDVDEVSPAQMRSLVDLVNQLRRYYGIPLQNIMGHRDVPGSHTDCPGTSFPWKKFKRKL